MLILFLRREDRKRSSQDHTVPASEASSSKKSTEVKTETESRAASPRTQSPQPGPSGIQQKWVDCCIFQIYIFTKNIIFKKCTLIPRSQQRGSDEAGDLNAPDLQLDCLSSDTDTDIAEEDVTVVKISRYSLMIF